MTTIDHSVADHSAAHSSPTQRAITVAAAVVAAAALWVVASAVLSSPLTVSFDGGDTSQEVGIGSVLVTSALAGLAGWGLLAVLEKAVPARAATVWTAVAVVVLLLSLGGPVSAGVATGTTVTLVLLHLLVGAVLIARLPRRG